MSRLLLTVAFACGLLAVVVVGGCTRVPPPGGAQGAKPDQARKQAEGLALSVVNGVAAAQAKANPSLARKGDDAATQARANPPATRKGGGGLSGRLIAAIGEGVGKTRVSASASSTTGAKGAPQPTSSPRPGSPAAIKERVASSFPYASEAEAEEDAFANARDVIERRLAELDPPVKYRPSLNEVKNEFVRRDSRTLHPPEPAEQKEYKENGVGSNLNYAEYDVEVTADQIRELRTRDRVADALRVLAGLAVAALAGFLFLRADEWTKGYLTRWLAFAAVVVAGGAAAALYFV